MDDPEVAALAMLAANVRRHRLSAVMTQAELAEAVGVEPRFIQAIEAGTDAPGFKNLVGLATALGIELRDLFVPATPAQRNPGRPPKRERE